MSKNTKYQKKELPIKSNKKTPAKVDKPFHDHYLIFYTPLKKILWKMGENWQRSNAGSRMLKNQVNYKEYREMLALAGVPKTSYISLAIVNTKIEQYLKKGPGKIQKC